MPRVPALAQTSGRKRWRRCERRGWDYRAYATAGLSGAKGRVLLLAKLVHPVFASLLQAPALKQDCLRAGADASFVAHGAVSIGLPL